jgi:hypothetical protein
MKCEEDFLQVDQAPPRALRRAVVRVGEPIDLAAWLAARGQSRARQLVPALTAEIESKLQALLDSMPPGRPLAGPDACDAPNGTLSSEQSADVLPSRAD